MKIYDISHFISDSGMITDAIRPVAGEELSFVASTTANPELPLLPFYAVYDQKYTVYFDVFSEKEWALKEMEYQKMMEEQRLLEAHTTDLFRIGEMQPEREHGLESENSNSGYANGYAFRDAFNGWFSFDVKVDSTQKMQMICSYWGADKDKRNFDILIDGVLFKTVKLDGTHGNKVFEEVYEIPLSFTQGKENINVRFQSRADCYAGGLFWLPYAKSCFTVEFVIPQLIVMNANNNKKSYLFPMIVMSVLFFMVGFITTMNNSLIDFLSSSKWMLSFSEKQLVNTSFFWSLLVLYSFVLSVE